MFGDGAGAAVLRAADGTGTIEDRGVLATKIYADGYHYDNLKTDGGVSGTQTTGHIVMDGKEVFKYAVNCMPQAAEDAMKEAGISADDVDWLIPHQANIRIIEGVGKNLESPMKKSSSTLPATATLPPQQFPLPFRRKWKTVRLRKATVLS